MKLTEQEYEILDHTQNRAAGKRFCGSSKEMDSLVKKGMMRYLGTLSFVPDKYYTITKKGEEVLQQKNKSQ